MRRRFIGTPPRMRIRTSRQVCARFSVREWDHILLWHSRRSSNVAPARRGVTSYETREHIKRLLNYGALSRSLFLPLSIQRLSQTRLARLVPPVSCEVIRSGSPRGSSNLLGSSCEKETRPRVAEKEMPFESRSAISPGCDPSCDKSRDSRFDD